DGADLELRSESQRDGPTDPARCSCDDRDRLGHIAIYPPHPNHRRPADCLRFGPTPDSTMDTLLQDIRFAVRTIRKQRGTSTVAVVCLALGIGANTAIFSVVRAVLMESLPYRDPSRIVRVYETANFAGTRGTGSVSVPNFLDWRREQRPFVDLAAYSAGSVDLAGEGNPERVRAVRATPAIGRAFTSDEDQPGRNPVVVLRDGFWRRRFGADRAVVGKLVSLDNKMYTVIGVMPPSFDFPIAPIHNDVWFPLLWSENEMKFRGNHWLSVVARLKPGVDSAAAAAQMTPIAQRIGRDFPDEQKDRGIQVNTLNGIVVGRVRTPLLMLLGAVGLVLLIACAKWRFAPRSARSAGGSSVNFSPRACCSPRRADCSVSPWRIGD